MNLTKSPQPWRTKSTRMGLSDSKISCSAMSRTKDCTLCKSRYCQFPCTASLTDNEQGWHTPAGDAHFQERQSRAVSLDEKAKRRMFNMMRAIAKQSDEETGAYTLVGDKPKALDLCMAPGGFIASRAVEGIHPATESWREGLGMYLPRTPRSVSFKMQFSFCEWLDRVRRVLVRFKSHGSGRRRD